MGYSLKSKPWILKAKIWETEKTPYIKKPDTVNQDTVEPSLKKPDTVNQDTVEPSLKKPDITNKNIVGEGNNVKQFI